MFHARIRQTAFVNGVALAGMGLVLAIYFLCAQREAIWVRIVYAIAALVMPGAFGVYCAWWGSKGLLPPKD